MIEATSLTKEYSGINVVDGLDLNVEKGEIFGFLGPNGAGKTTTIRMLTTLTRPTSGSIFIDGFDVVKEPSRVKSVFGIVQQHQSLNRELTVRENLEVHAKLHHLSRLERKKRIDELIDYVDMAAYADQLIDTISGGMKRRTMIARALIHRPKLLILDEPTVGLDAQTRRRVWDLIRGMNSEGATVFLTTHYIEEAEALSDRVGILHHGKLISVGHPLDLRRKLGLMTVETKENGRTKYSFFQDRIAASKFIQEMGAGDKVVMRQSNLEDVFVELTGQKVDE
jgi:ABC-2 type transport system ATP-binding protein